MKNVFKLFILIIVVNCFLSCGEMLSAMSAVNQANGSQCAYYVATSYAYDDGKWNEGVCFESEDYSDCNWLSNKQELYLSYNRFDTYYVTSPYSGKEYKVSVYCSSYY